MIPKDLKRGTCGFAKPEDLTQQNALCAEGLVGDEVAI